MPSEFWGDIELPPDVPLVPGKEPGTLTNGESITISGPDLLVGTAMVVTVGKDGKTMLGVDFAKPKPQPMKVTINDIQLGLPESIWSRTDEIGESVTEIKLSEAQLNRLYEEHGKAQITQTQLDGIMGALQPTMEIAEEIKKTLTDRGWTYEEAERIAGDFLRDSITNAMRSALS